jgi:hypothetical protein
MRIIGNDLREKTPEAVRLSTHADEKIQGVQDASSELNEEVKIVKKKLGGLTRHLLEEGFEFEDEDLPED